MKRKKQKSEYDHEFELLSAFFRYGVTHREAEITSSESRRIAIFHDALKAGAGINSVQAALQAENLRSIYIRDPYELVLFYCFYHNEYTSHQKFTFITFTNLIKELELEGFNARTPITRQEKDKRLKSKVPVSEKQNRAQKTVTFGDVAEFISMSPADPEQLESPQMLITQDKTLQMRREFVRLLEEEPNVQSIRSYIDAHRSDFVDVSYSVRFYFCKYIFLIICHQILELKEILLQFSETTPETYIEKRSHSSRDYTWSIGTAVDERIINPNAYDTQKSKMLLSAALDKFLLRGSSVTERCFGILAPNDPLSYIKNKTLIFVPSKDASLGKNSHRQETHEFLKQRIADMTIEDFYGYSINLPKLYDFLFEEIFLKTPALSEEEEDKVPELNKRKRQYISRIIDGEFDMTRSALIMFLASSKCLLYSLDYFAHLRPDIFNDEDSLSVDRVNCILERCGYLHLLDDLDSKYAAVDEYYYILFEADSEDLSVYEDLKAILLEYSSKDQFNPFHFETPEMSSTERRRRIMKDEGYDKLQ